MIFLAGDDDEAQAGRSRSDRRDRVRAGRHGQPRDSHRQEPGARLYDRPMTTPEAERAMRRVSDLTLDRLDAGAAQVVRLRDARFGGAARARAAPPRLPRADLDPRRAAGSTRSTAPRCRSAPARHGDRPRPGPRLRAGRAPRRRRRALLRRERSPSPARAAARRRGCWPAAAAARSSCRAASRTGSTR